MSLAGEPLEESPAAFLTHHIVVPAAIIAMVASFLFYLVDVRSAFLGGGPALKWVGFCFAVATVLIERYGRSSGVDADLQGIYTLALAGATAAVMLISPWAGHAAAPGERLANLLIVAVVWRFATRVTRGLSPETGKAPKLSRDLLSVAPEIWMGTVARQPSPPPVAVPRNPAATVARLAAAALLAFALGEPVLLAAAPQTGMRALAAVVLFLFSTGVVLAAGSGMDALRRAEGAGGRVSPGVVPSRVGVAALLLGVVLASALAVPGLDFQGTGRLRPPTAEGKGEELDRGYQETEDAGRISTRPPEEEAGSSSKDSSSPDSTPLGGLAGALLSPLAAAGRWLLVPLILALVTVGIWSLVRLWPLLKGWRSKAGDRWRALLNSLAGLFRRIPLPSFGGGPGADPLKNLDDLLDLPSREAVLAAYHRFLVLLENLGHARPEKATPYEVLNGLPPDLKHLEDPARTLTDLYVLAAYAADPVEQGSQERAITALKGMRGLLEKTAA